MSDTPSFLAETPAETAEFESVRDGTAVETPPTPEPAAEPPKAAEPAPEPAKAAEPAKPPEPAKPDERPKFVPHAALHEERLKRQALEKELADLRAGRQPEPEKTAEIDPETDPIGALKEIREWKEQQRQQGLIEQQNKAFEARVQTHEADFSSATPDYGDAIAHLRDAVAKEIVDVARTFGQTITQQQLAAELRHRVLSTADLAFKAGKNPGEVFYELAKARGYALKAPEPAKVETPVAIEPSKEAVETIERLTRGHKAAKVGGGDPPSGGGEMTLEALAKLDGAAFDSAFEKFSKAQRAVH